MKYTKEYWDWNNSQDDLLIKRKTDNIEVYFESKSSAELVATFNDEEIYMACVPVLEKLAKEHRMILTETIK